MEREHFCDECGGVMDYEDERLTCNNPLPAEDRAERVRDEVGKFWKLGGKTRPPYWEGSDANLKVLPELIVNINEHIETGVCGYSYSVES